ncbi:MAG TPA: glycosyltransferase family 39 protein [Pyrinomonadaceae bacterium]|jgi:uncharacterized membrane protein YhaH (DUF805 family)
MVHSGELVTGKVGARRAAAAVEGARRRVWALDRRAVLVLVALALVGLGLRARGLGAVGFAEDETNKLEAVRAYGRGDLTQNAEHPMLMKALIYVSVRAAAAWNARGPAGDTLQTLDISDEAALRLPNALLGALTVFPLCLLTVALFDRRTGLLAAAFWACGVNAVTYNRVGKEDTLLVFFLLFAFYFYLRAKQTTGFEPQRKHRFYAWSAVSFGLMLASKYFPHYFGLNMLYHHLVRVRRPAPGEPPGRTPRFFYLLIAAAFLAANPALFSAQTWTYLSAYSGEQLLTHHGYLMGDVLYRNNPSSTPFGTPVYFYALYLAIKTPLPVLAALLVGLTVCARRWREPGPAFLLLMFVLWIVPYSLFGAKWLRYTLSLMPFVYMLAAVGVAALLGWGARAWPGRAAWVVPLRALVVLLFIGWPAWVAYAAGPHYALYTNALGAGRAGYYFPHDEFYDDGLREALRYVCEHAPPGATVVQETPGVARYYLARYGRADLQARALSDPRFDVTTAPRPAFYVLQRGRTYFENREKMAQVRAAYPRVYEGFVESFGATASAVEVYAAQ